MRLDAKFDLVQVQPLSGAREFNLGAAERCHVSPRRAAALGTSPPDTLQHYTNA